MKIYVVGSSKNEFLPLDNIREKFLIDQKHSGDNIDFLNPWYCELTGLYYLWKHTNDDIIGLEHYRRYFVNNKCNLLSKEEIEKILKNHDVIAHHRRKYTKFKTIKDELINVTKDSITIDKFEKFINYYDKNFNLFAEPVKYSFNMAIGKRCVLAELYDQLFNIMNEFVIETDVHNIKKRTIGYISEFYFSYLLGMCNIAEVDVYSLKFNRIM